MEARMKNPATILDVVPAVQGLYRAAHRGGVSPETLDLVHLRASQINGCSACVDSGARRAKERGETDERLWSVAAWREAPFYSDAERAALALAEQATRLADGGAGVSDEVWAAVTEHFDEQQAAALVLWIATTNFFNRINRTIQEPAGATWG